MKFAIALTASLAAVTLPTHAEIIPLKLTPGLWEETRVTMINGKNVDEAMRKARERMMERLTPEQRKTMQEQMGRSGGGPVQTCLTPAQVAKGIDTADIKRKMEESARGCNLDIISADSAGAKFKASCMGPNGNGYHGTGEYVVTSPKEWRFKMVGDANDPGPSASPTPQAVGFHATQEVTARWKGSDCGSVPPRREG